MTAPHLHALRAFAALALLVAGLARAVRPLTRRGPGRALTPAASTDGSSRLLLVLLPAGGLVGLVSFVVFGAPWLLAHQVSPAAPGQPIVFDHQVHSQVVGLDCAFCHRTAVEGTTAGLPDVQQCMFCHAVVEPTVVAQGNAEPIAQLRLAWADQQPIDWTAVHRIPDHTRFPHEAHVRAGVACETCHGDVARMSQMTQVRPLKMGDCVACHRDDGAPTQCGACHY